MRYKCVGFISNNQKRIYTNSSLLFTHTFQTHIWSQFFIPAQRSKAGAGADDVQLDLKYTADEWAPYRTTANFFFF